MKRWADILRSPFLKRRAVWLIALAGCCAFLPVSIPDADEFTTPETLEELGKQRIGPGEEVIQDFPATGPQLMRVRPRLLTEPVGKVGFHFRLERLVNKRWNVLWAKALESDPAYNDRQFRIRFIPPIDVRVGERLRFVLTAGESPGSTLFIRVNPEWEDKDYGLFVNQERRPGTAVFQTNYERTWKPLWRQIPAFVARITVMMGPVGKTLLILGVLLTTLGVLALLREPEDGPS